MNIQKEKNIVTYYAIYDQYYGSAGSNNIYFWSERKVDLKQKYLYTWSFICEKPLHYQYKIKRIIVTKKKR